MSGLPPSATPTPPTYAASFPLQPGGDGPVALVLHYAEEQATAVLPVGQRLRVILPSQGGPPDPGWSMSLHWYGHGGDWGGIAWNEQSVTKTLTGSRPGKVAVQASWDYACFHYVQDPCSTRPVYEWSLTVTVVKHGRASFTPGKP